ncbi:MAG: DUF2384 domain-containing protein [Gammaproteobacteria bacterium]|nr:DUF2384 domain-containing protein [Gammaproteobacteria bacterium]
MTEARFSLASAAAERLGGCNSIGCEVRTDADLVAAVEAGFRPESLAALSAGGVSDQEIATLVINPRTLSHRRAKGERLTVDESDRAARLARTMALADRTFANSDKASRWLHKELRVLGGRRPIDLIRTQVGARIVEDVLRRIAWGAPS